MNGTLPTLFGGLLAVITLFLVLARLPSQLRGLIAAGIPLLGYFVYIIGHWPGLDVAAIHIAVFSSAAFVMAMIDRYRGRAGGKLHWVPVAFIVFFLLLAVLMAGFLYIANQGLPPRIAALVLPGADKTTIRTGFSGVLAHGDEAAKTVGSQLSEQYQQDQLGWTVALQGLRMPSRGENEVTVEAGDADGNALRGLTVVMNTRRPGETGQGTAVVLAESSGGAYTGRLFLPQSGLWLVSLSLTHGKDRHHQEWEIRVP